jgi:hypothetical protein
MLKYVVITSIQGVTECVQKYAEIEDWHIVLVGDRKTPPLDRHPHPNVTFLSVAGQEQLGSTLYKLCPFDHYSRKNLGYLYAIERGAEVIADADDDNMPYPHWGRSMSFQHPETEVVSSARYVNVYRYFTDQFVWPRGYPLSAILEEGPEKASSEPSPRIDVVQGLVDGDPDVDAIYRLTIRKPVDWRQRSPVVLDRGAYCPINSQNTVWTKDAFAYLYLPTTVTFRFTDILRGYIAQAGVWSRGGRVAFTSPTVFQDRNAHDLNADFLDEVPCYTQVAKLVEILDALEFPESPGAGLLATYRALCREGIVASQELETVQAWIEDLGTGC